MIIEKLSSNLVKNMQLDQSKHTLSPFFTASFTLDRFDRRFEFMSFPPIHWEVILNFINELIIMYHRPWTLDFIVEVW